MGKSVDVQNVKRKNAEWDKTLNGKNADWDKPKNVDWEQNVEK
jgi:hypothetical protein